MTSLRQSGILLAILALASTAISQESGEVAKLPGIAWVTSSRGEPIRKPESGKGQIPLQPRSTFSPGGNTLLTGTDEQAFLALSNGVTLGLDENTEVRVLKFTQAPFEAEKESLTLEPSISELEIEFRSGRLALVSEHLSPLSELRIRTEFGEVRIHNVSALIESGPTGLWLVAKSGSLTLYHGDDRSREFVSGPAAIRISRESSALGRVAESIDKGGISNDWENVIDATEYSGKRVLFREGDGQRVARPIQIVPSEYYTKPSPRPFSFIDPSTDP